MPAKFSFLASSLSQLVQINNADKTKTRIKTNLFISVFLSVCRLHLSLPFLQSVISQNYKSQNFCVVERVTLNFVLSVSALRYWAACTQCLSVCAVRDCETSTVSPVTKLHAAITLELPPKPLYFIPVVMHIFYFMAFIKLTISVVNSPFKGKSGFR